MLKRRKDLLGVCDYLTRRQCAALVHIRAQRHTVDIFHYKIFVLRFHRNIVYCNNVGVRQHRHSARFVKKPRYRIRIARDIVAQHFYGYGAILLLIMSAKDYRHTAGAEHFFYSVPAVKQAGHVFFVRVPIKRF